MPAKVVGRDKLTDSALLQITVEPRNASVELDDEGFAGDREVWVTIGKHVLVVSSPGAITRRENVEATRGKLTEIHPLMWVVSIAFVVFFLQNWLSAYLPK